MKSPIASPQHSLPARGPLAVVLAVSLGAIIGCRSADAEATVKVWVQAIARGDITAARATYDPQGWPDGYIIWERDFAKAIVDSAQVSYERQATFAAERAQVVVRTRTEDMRIAWIFKLRRTPDGKWVIVNILRYFE